MALPAASRPAGREAALQFLHERRQVGRHGIPHDVEVNLGYS